MAEVQGFDLSISGIHNELCFITDFAQYDIRVNPSNEHELFMPDGALAGDLLLREKLPTAQGTSLGKKYSIDSTPKALSQSFFTLFKALSESFFRHFWVPEPSLYNHLTPLLPRFSFGFLQQL